MYAVFQLAGEQFRAEKGQILRVPRLSHEKGTKFDISEVLLIKDNEQITVGNPFVENAKIVAEVIENGQADKVLIYKYKRRTKYRRRQGHRQDFTEIKINKIEKAAKKSKSEN